MMAYDLVGFLIFNIKGVDYRCVLWLEMMQLTGSKLDDKGTIWIWILMQVKYLIN